MSVVFTTARVNITNLTNSNLFVLILCYTNTACHMVLSVRVFSNDITCGYVKLLEVPWVCLFNLENVSYCTIFGTLQNIPIFIIISIINQIINFTNPYRNLIVR